MSRSKSIQSRQHMHKILAGNKPAKWLFTGDSIPHGALHTHGNRDYVELFSERLRYELGRRLDCVIKTAVSGWTIRDIMQHLELCVLQYQPNVVSISVGVNDSCAGLKQLNVFIALYSEIIARIRMDTNAEVIMHTPPPILPLATVVKRYKHVSAYAVAIRELSASLGVILIDNESHWSQIDIDKRAFWYNDGVHPNEYGHRAIATKLMTELGMYDSSSNTCRLFIP
ncbi:MAG: SGNH/GDSL hydrolase family protein [Phycisphaeraceae bacterium]|nr:SGNH/GDSL hydrolase family protein [Phycisphaeraceae bacterium]